MHFMGAYINIGNAGFRSARNGEYVDKMDSDAAKVAEYSDNLLLVGISYDRETKQHNCRIERM